MLNRINIDGIGSSTAPDTRRNTSRRAAPAARHKGVGGQNFRGDGLQTAFSLTSHKMKIFKIQFSTHIPPSGGLGGFSFLSPLWGAGGLSFSLFLLLFFSFISSEETPVITEETRQNPR